MLQSKQRRFEIQAKKDFEIHAWGFVAPPKTFGRFPE
jgi:hypothetical protein